MFYACWRLICKNIAVSVRLAAIAIAFVPVCFIWHVDRLDYFSEGALNQMLIRTYRFPGVQQTCFAIWIGGWVVALAALFIGAYFERKDRWRQAGRPPE